MLRITSLALCLMASTVIFAQKVAINKVQLEGDKIIVHYDLEDDNPNHEYQVGLYSSQNNFAIAMSHVTGDVGSEVKSGLDRKIIWSIRDELGPYKGKLALEVRGKVYTPFVKLQGFDVEKKYKRGKSYPMTWKAYSSDPVHIELYKGSQRVDGVFNHPNDGSYSLSLPANAKPGKDYRIKFTNSRSNDEVIYTGYFRVTPKVPMLLKVVPVLALGGAAAVFLSGNGGEPSPGGGDERGGGEIEFPPFPTN